MVVHKAQDVAARPRTEDIELSEDIDFKSMLLPEPILKGLKLSGYIRPSPIQKKALPLVRCGFDLTVQAKAGTGKTCIFAVAALELVQPKLPHLQAVVLAPTREIALQITEVFNALGQAFEGLKTGCFIGGYPIALDKENAEGCHIAIGSPGRIRHLMHKGLLDPSRTRLFVLDEADKLMEKSFIRDINEIFSYLPESKQVLALSATYTPELIQYLNNYMNHGQFVTPQKTASSTVLVGIRQFITVLSHHVDKLARLRLKERHLLYLLRTISFNQCLVFSNLQSRAVSVCNMLRKEGWGVEWIAGSQGQEDRVIAISQLKEERVRVLITTDLTARGIDVENVNLIINLDVPNDYQTYLHRMGRAGRYGSHGMVVTILAAGNELISFQKLLGAIGGTSQYVYCVPEDLRNVDLWSSPEEEFKQVFGIVENLEIVTNDPEKSPEGTESDGKCSVENSDNDKSPVINLCDDKKVPLKDLCSCNLFEVGPSDIKSVSGPSLFSLAEKETHWRDVLPVVNEFQIPLNTPLALLDTKLIRIRFLSNISRSEIQNVEQIRNPVCFSDFEISHDSGSTFLTFDEIKCILENEEYFQINLDNSPKENGGFLSVQEVEHFLENDVTKCEVKEEENDCAPLTAVDQILVKYNNNKTKLEDSLIDFDSFDVVGWMAVDEKLNIIESIVNDKLSIFEFEVVDCPGKKHIKVVSSFNKGYCEKDIFEDHILTLNINNFGLVKPFSLETIAEKMTVRPDVQQTRKESSTSKMSSSSYNNIPLPNCNGVSKNGYDKLKKSKMTPKKHELGRHEEHEDVQISDKNIKKCNHKNYTKASFKIKVPNSTNVSTTNTAKKGVVGYSNLNTQKMYLPKQAKKMPCKPESNRAKLDLKRHDQENPVTKTSYHATKNQVTDNGKGSLNSTAGLSELSNESDTSTSENLIPNGSKHQLQLSCSSEDSVPYVDMTQSLEKWQKLHDCEESDSGSSISSAVPNVTNCAVKHFSDSSSNIKTQHSAKNRKLPRQNIYTSHEFNSSSSYDTYESVLSNPHSFRTACSQQDVYIPPYISFNHCSHPNMADNYCRLQNPKKEFFYNPSSCCRAPDRCFPNEHGQAPKAMSEGYQASSSHQYQGRYFNSQPRKGRKSTRRTYDDETISQQRPKRLTSKNLCYDWYSTWYTELRQRANHLEYVEYINMMSTP